MTGFLYRSFRLAGPSCLNHLYKALVLPVLDYCSPIWDPAQKCYIQALERCQNFAARVVTNDWSGSPTELKASLGWPLLAVQKICLCRQILQGNSLIPRTMFKPHPRPGTQHKNSLPIFRPRVRTNHLRNFFPIDVVGKWNTIPNEVASASSILSFKLRLKQLYLS